MTRNDVPAPVLGSEAGTDSAESGSFPPKG